ncbi:hypothetical protein CGZ91_11730 [Parenemella sanctibonifatiensis]|uniref:DUF8175 domain-containing protein n=1 Tax=Parenemella sanctibonifatiensis TaxID=2016505 RepID=A0A255EN43_9ACTN|nr:hypothetical protein CGZ91_11730 [Parenemella sanctibonifatiensis]
MPVRLVIVAAAVVALVIAILVVVIVVVANRPGPGPDPATASPTVTPSAGADTSAPPPSVEPLERSVVPVGAEYATGKVGPLFTGYEQTPDGATAAALNYIMAIGSPEMYDDRTRHQVEAYMYVDAATAKKWGLSDELAAKLRSKLGTDSTGKPLDPTKTNYSGYYPELGAFQVMKVVGNTEVTIMVWYPAVDGVGNKRADLLMQWNYTQFRLVWSDGDWRIADWLDTPTPPSPKGLELSFDERARLLGKGWQLPANAVEHGLERLRLPEK